MIEKTHHISLNEISLANIIAEDIVRGSEVLSTKDAINHYALYSRMRIRLVLLSAKVASDIIDNNERSSQFLFNVIKSSLIINASADEEIMSRIKGDIDNISYKILETIDYFRETFNVEFYHTNSC